MEGIFICLLTNAIRTNFDGITSESCFFVISDTANMEHLEGFFEKISMTLNPYSLRPLRNDGLFAAPATKHC
jgi:hypothetical protein